MNPNKIAIILGPTASGKTGQAINAAKRLDAEIISADSMQIYKQLDIGSAKPTKKEQNGIPHHLIDFLDITTINFSVAEYKRMALDCITEIERKGKIPLVVGGTGLYIHSLTHSLDFAGAPANADIRNELLRKEQAEPGWAYEELSKVDDASYKRLHKNDLKRIIRALEVYLATGKPMSEYTTGFRNDEQPPCDAVMIGLTMPRTKLYERINLRVNDMMERGLLNEVKQIAAMDINTSLPALQGLGYKQLLQHINGECSLDEAVEAIKRETRRYAKRQLTWFKRDERIIWLDVSEFKYESSLNDAICSIIVSYFKKREV